MAFTLRLSDDLDAALSAKSASTGVPKAVIVRRILENELLLRGATGGMARELPSAPAPTTTSAGFRPDFKKT